MFFKDLLALFFIQSIQNEFDIVTLLKKLIFIFVFVFLSFARIGSAGSSNTTLAKYKLIKCALHCLRFLWRLFYGHT